MCKVDLHDCFLMMNRRNQTVMLDGWIWSLKRVQDIDTLLLCFESTEPRGDIIKMMPLCTKYKTLNFEVRCMTSAVIRMFALNRVLYIIL